MPTTAQIRSAVTTYLSTVESGTSTDVAALYADDATLEDPVGSEIRSGRTAIAEFYRSLDGVSKKLELLTVRVSGDTAAFAFRVTTNSGDQTVTVEPIDVMTFDAAGRITSMRAIWSPDDITIS